MARLRSRHLSFLVFFAAKTAHLAAQSAGSLLTQTHPSALAQGRLFEAAFSDSGHWDYALLAAFEAFSRVVIVCTVSPVSESSVAEKAGWAASALVSALPFDGVTPGATGFGAASLFLGWGVLTVFGALALNTFAAYL